MELSPSLAEILWFPLKIMNYDNQAGTPKTRRSMPLPPLIFMLHDGYAGMARKVLAHTKGRRSLKFVSIGVITNATAPLFTKAPGHQKDEEWGADPEDDGSGAEDLF